MELVIQVADKEAPFLMELLMKFDFVKLKQPSNSTVLQDLEVSLLQMQAMREGKLPKPSISELFEE